MKLAKPEYTLSQIGSEIALINQNIFQMKQFIQFIVPMIEKGESIDKLQKVVNTFNPLEAVKNLETK